MVNVWDFVDDLPTFVQFLTVFVLAAIPVIETEWAAIVGTLAGIP